MSHQPPTEIGTAFFPEPDITPNGSGATTSTRDGRPGDGRMRDGQLRDGQLRDSQLSEGQTRDGRLRGLPRRRRPGMIALAIALAGAGVVVSAAVYQRTDHLVGVVMVTEPVAAGAVITSADLATANVNVGAGIHVIPASQIGEVSGEIAAVALRPATLLAPTELTTSRPPRPGQELVPVPVKPYLMPASGLAPGDHVLLVPTPGDEGQPGSATGTPSLAAPVAALVEAVSDVPDQDGLDVVDLLVSNAEGAAITDQVSTGQFALIVTKRES